MNNNTSHNFLNLEDFDWNQNSPKDRYVISRNKLDYIAKNLESPKFQKKNNENTFFNQILKKNLQENSPIKFNEHNFQKSLKLKLPYQKKNTYRKIDPNPFKVLDAGHLQDDYYINVIDWSSSNNLAVGLGNTVYVWNYFTNNISRLKTFKEDISCVKWDKFSDKLIIGTVTGKVEYWDFAERKNILKLTDHKERVGALSLHNNKLLTGSKDSSIYFYDIRVNSYIKSFQDHKQEICGLEWSNDSKYFASGGNDNKLFVYYSGMDFPIMRKTHKAAVRAIGWSKRREGILASGAGSADRLLRVWDVSKKKLIIEKDTGSQICSLVFSKLSDEIITSHGFSNNEINIWKSRDLDKVCSLKGHTSRVLYLTLSPDGENIVSGAGDETLRFWNLGYKRSCQNSSFVDLFNPVILR